MLLQYSSEVLQLSLIWLLSKYDTVQVTMTNSVDTQGFSAVYTPL